MGPAVVFFLTCALLSTRVADDNSLEDQLTDLFRDKVLVLGHSFKSGVQEYAADGTPLKNAEEGAWTLCSSSGPSPLSMTHPPSLAAFSPLLPKTSSIRHPGIGDPSWRNYWG